MDPHLAHEVTGIVKDIAEVIGFSAAAIYFAWRVFFQRSFQRLSADIGLTPLRPPNAAQPCPVVVECKIENKAEARIDLEWLRYRLLFGAQPTCGDFPGNMSRHGVGAYHAIDAEATCHFNAQAEVPHNTLVVVVVVEFRPRLSGNTYTIQKVVALDRPCGPNQALQPKSEKGSGVE